MRASTQAFVGLLGLYLALVLSAAVGRWGAPGIPGPSTSKLSTGMRVDPNTADAATLELLPGVGPGIAEHIVEAREGGMVFRDAQDLKRVKFIGPSLVQRVGPWTVYATGSQPETGALSAMQPDK
jgi:hypothetical protein